MDEREQAPGDRVLPAREPRNLLRPSTTPTGFQREESLPVQRLGGDCWSLTLRESVQGRSSITVTEISGGPGAERAMREDEDGQQIRSTWGLRVGGAHAVAGSPSPPRPEGFAGGLHDR